MRMESEDARRSISLSKYVNFFVINMFLICSDHIRESRYDLVCFSRYVCFLVGT